MCYAIYLSTTTGEDLALIQNEHFRFGRVRNVHDPSLRFLKYPHVWMLFNGNCSCGFRRAIEGVPAGSGALPGSVAIVDNAGLPLEPEFCEPSESACAEYEDVVAHTHAAYEELRRIVLGGDKLDLLDYWLTDDNDLPPKRLSAHVKRIPKEKFRFFTSYHMVLRP